MLSPKYQRHIEDFICENCGLKVIGNGFTNHCPNCLWSKHVDINPGDRAEACKGMMKPVAIELRNGLYYVLQRCVLCGFERKNQVKDNDNFEVVIGLSANIR